MNFLQLNYKNEVNDMLKLIKNGFKITKIFAGLRTTNEMKKVIRSILPENVSLYETRISPRSNAVEINEDVGDFKYEKEGLSLDI